MDVQALKAHSPLALVVGTKKTPLGAALSNAKRYHGKVLAGGLMRFRLWGVELIFHPDSV